MFGSKKVIHLVLLRSFFFLIQKTNHYENYNVKEVQWGIGEVSFYVVICRKDAVSLALRLEAGENSYPGPFHSSKFAFVHL